MDKLQMSNSKYWQALKGCSRCWAITVLFGLAAMMGFFIIGPLIEHAASDSEVVKHTFGQEPRAAAFMLPMNPTRSVPLGTATVARRGHGYMSDMWQSEEEPGSFVRPGSELAPDAFGPPAVVVGGLNEEQLELLDDVLASALNDGKDYSTIPLIVLAQEDGKVPLKTLLEKAVERDHVLPSKKAMAIQPFTMFSGLPMPSVRKVMATMRASGLPAFAPCVVVPRAMDKEMGRLTEEVVDDYEFTYNEKLTSE